MSVLDRKLGREVKASWPLLATITSIMAVGVACYVSMASAYNNLTDAKTRYYRQCRMADFWVDVKKIPLSELDAVAELAGVAEIRPRIQFFSTVDLDDAARPLNGQVLSLPDRREPTITDVVLVRGGYFTDRRQNEVIVNAAFAKHHGLEPGQWIRLVLNHRRQELFIVGTAISSEFVYLLGPGAITPEPEHFGVFYIKQSYAEDVFDFDGATNQVLGRLTPDARARPGEILDRIERVLSPYGVFMTTPLADQASNKYLTQEIDGLGTFGLFMPAIFLAVAAMVLNVLLTRLAEQQRTVIGTFKALGYHDGQIFLHFLKFGLIVGLGGGLLGAAGGYIIAGWMTSIYRQFFEFPELHNRFFPTTLSAAVSISLLFAVVGSFRGARTVLRLQPAEAMRPKPPKEGGPVFLERVGWIWRRLGASWRMVLRDVIRNRMRTAAGMFAAMMGASVLVTSFMMVEATNYLIDFQFKWLLKSDLELTFKNEQGDDALAEVARLPGVDWAEPVLGVAGTFENGLIHKKGAIIGLIPNARLTVPRDSHARPIRVPSAGVAMSRKLAEVLKLERGDTVTFRPIKGLRQPHQVPVVEIADGYLGTTVYADIHYLSRLVGEELAMTGVQLTTDQNPRHTQALYRELKQMPALEAVGARPDMIRSLEETLLQNMWVSILMLVMFAGIVFFGSIFNASLVSLAERQREVATLRVLGYGPWQIGTLLLRESIIVTMIGTVLGMPLGYLLTVLAAMSYESEMFRFPVVSSAGTWVWTAILAIFFTLAAHLCVQWTIHRMDWLDAIKAKE